MTNQEKYNFEDFTIEHYRALIKKIKERYKFSFYHNFDKNIKFVLWRHDIDFSPQRALRCAQIEKEEGVKATYFLHLHSEFYNFFEKGIFDIIKQIISLGHQIGVHFDIHFYNIKTEEDIIKNLEYEKKLLENLFDIEVKSFSFHNTDAFIMSCQKWQYAGLINSYASYFQKEVTYCSDSNGYWRYKRMMDVVNEDHSCLHLLTHCEWWTEEIMSPWQKIERAINGRASFCKENYIDILSKHNNLNIDWQ